MSKKENVVLYADVTIMGVAFIYLLMESFRKLPSRRMIHYLLGWICGSSAIAYAMMHEGFLAFKAMDGHTVQGAQYLDWIVTTPVQLLVVGIMAQVPPASLVGLCYLDVLMNVCGLLGEYAMGASRWIYFAVGCFLFLPQWIFWYFDIDFAMVRDFFGNHVAQSYYCLGQLVFSTRILFPIIWVLYATQLLDSYQALLCYSITAIIAKIGFCVWVLLCLSEFSSTTPEDLSSSDASPPMEGLEDENALSIVHASRTNSNYSSPR
jgi:sensory rhodopsin